MGNRINIKSNRTGRNILPSTGQADFLVDMSFSVKDIEGMLNEYETDHQTGMDIPQMAGMIYEYTSGYPYLVSRFCSYLDGLAAQTGAFPDKSSVWTWEGFHEAEKKIVKEDNTLYQSLIRKLELYPRLREILYEFLFTRKPVPYIATNSYLLQRGAERDRNQDMAGERLQ